MQTQPDAPDLVAAKLARALDERALRTLFSDARTAAAFLPIPVPHELLERALSLASLGPTSSNSQPLRVVFVESAAAKERLVAALSPGNVEKTREAPVTAVFAADARFYEHMPRLNPQSPGSASRFAGDDGAARALQFATMNATLQGAYFMLAARALGLDVGPMGGFDRTTLDETFFPDGRFRSIWLANLGFADDGRVRPRNPRFSPAEIASFV